ncbi:hypothetical protein LEP48_06310 [Isoptericola sp. NEAU-Y5]|uniref:DUF4064 domain-containing protein n=1 Tax=Isoptericola luteus TaxID=2879484 RepID=A0ABS7ZD40_9MICO|nr:hypothetical protein [Isoptericola sp. NEAU-Y5]
MAAPPVRRTVESWLAVAGMVVSTVFLGGFAVVMNRVDEAQFLATLYPELRAVGIDLPRAEAYQAAATLGAWFGFTLVTVLLLGAIGLYVAGRRPARRATGWWFAAAGLVCLVGSQLVLYPVAFLFFCGAGLFALRAVPDRLPEHGSKR